MLCQAHVHYEQYLQCPANDQVHVAGQAGTDLCDRTILAIFRVQIRRLDVIHLRRGADLNTGRAKAGAALRLVHPLGRGIKLESMKGMTLSSIAVSSASACCLRSCSAANAADMAGAAIHCPSLMGSTNRLCGATALRVPRVFESLYGTLVRRRRGDEVGAAAQGGL